MKSIDTKLLKAIAERRAFTYRVLFRFKNGDEVEVNNDGLMQSGCEITQSAESSSFPLGNAYGKILTLSLVNTDERWSEYDFYGANIRVFLIYTFDDGTEEALNMGAYYVTEPETYGSTVEVTAVDYMCLADRAYIPTIQSGTLYEVLQDVFRNCELSLSNANFNNKDFVVTNIPTDKTCRNVIGMVAMLAGGCAVIDDADGESNKVKIISYNMDALPKDFDGGNFHNYGNTPILSGGDFTFSETDDLSGGTFNDMKYYHVLHKATDVTVCTDDVVITGITDGNLMVGRDTYMLKIENDLIADNPALGLDLILNAVAQLQFRPFEMNHVAYPVADVGDATYIVDRKQRNYKSIITDISFAFKGYTNIKCSAEAPLRGSSKYTTATTQTIQNKEDIRRGYDELSEEIMNASGSYTTVTPADATGEIANSFIVDTFSPDLDVNSDWYIPTTPEGTYTKYHFDGTNWVDETVSGISRIVYNHNKRELKNSNVIWKETATTRSVSTDYGEHWNFAMDASGSVLAKRLTAETINGVNIIGSNFKNAELSPSFSVDEDGYLKATKGEIGQFSIVDGKLKVNDAVLSRWKIACGSAGYGLASLVGDISEGSTTSSMPFLQLCIDSDGTSCLNGLRIYGNGAVVKYNASGGVEWTRFLSNLPPAGLDEILTGANGGNLYSASRGEIIFKGTYHT